VLDRLLPNVPLPSGPQMVHGRQASYLFPTWLPQADLQSLRSAKLGLLSKMLDPVALAAGLVALPGAAARFASFPRHDTGGKHDISS